MVGRKQALTTDAGDGWPNQRSVGHGKSICRQMLFQRWPDSIPKLGIAVTSLNESITFTNFQISENAVLFER